MCTVPQFWLIWDLFLWPHRLSVRWVWDLSEPLRYYGNSLRLPRENLHALLLNETRRGCYSHRATLRKEFELEISMWECEKQATKSEREGEYISDVIWILIKLWLKLIILNILVTWPASSPLGWGRRLVNGRWVSNTRYLLCIVKTILTFTNVPE